MKTLAYVAIVVALVSLIIGVISRLTMTPIAIVPTGALSAEIFLTFTNTCLLLAIAISLVEMAKK